MVYQIFLMNMSIFGYAEAIDMCSKFHVDIDENLHIHHN